MSTRDAFERRLIAQVRDWFDHLQDGPDDEISIDDFAVVLEIRYPETEPGQTLLAWTSTHTKPVDQWRLYDRAAHEAFDKWMKHGRALLSGSVHRGEAPIQLVLHEHDGDWQFLDGEEFEPGSKDFAVVHLHHVFDDHPDLGHLMDLPPGWTAERNPHTREWERSEDASPEPDG